MSGFRTLSCGLTTGEIHRGTLAQGYLGYQIQLGDDPATSVNKLRQVYLYRGVPGRSFFLWQMSFFPRREMLDAARFTPLAKLKVCNAFAKEKWLQVLVQILIQTRGQDQIC